MAFGASSVVHGKFMSERPIQFFVVEVVVVVVVTCFCIGEGRGGSEKKNDGEEELESGEKKGDTRVVN